MALDPGPIGKAIADYFISQKPADGVAITTQNLEDIWTGVMTLIYDDIKANMDVLPVAHTGPNLNNPIGQPINVTTGPGSGSTGATTAPEDIAGKGSVQ